MVLITFGVKAPLFQYKFCAARHGLMAHKIIVFSPILLHLG